MMERYSGNMIPVLEIQKQMCTAPSSEKQKNHNMIIIIRHRRKKKWKNAINAVHLLVQRRLRKVWRNPDPEGSSAYFH